MINLLLINPNSSASITAALQAAIEPHCPPQTTLAFWNPSTGPAGISDAVTAAQSTEACMDELQSPGIELGKYHGFLICCFSEHPLIANLAELLPQAVVLGMFHAGVAAALLRPGPFGIIATGTGPKLNLVAATAAFLGTTSSDRFAGVITSGLGITELQDPGKRDKVEQGMKETTRRLVDQGARTLVLGCAGMSGMDAWVIEAGAKQGQGQAVGVKVVDGARAGVELLLGMIRASR